jgi:hypothetical protein
MTEKYVRLEVWVTPAQKRKVKRQGVHQGSAYVRNLIDNDK